MAQSTCVKCGGTRFELKLVEPKDSGFKFNFVQCSSCGGVVGVLDYFNIGEQLKKLGQALGVKLT